MAVGKAVWPIMNPVKGVRLGTACASVNQALRDDLLIIEFSSGTACAGVFTRNAFCAAPVTVARKHLSMQPRWLVINSGNANAGTGAPGIEDARQVCSALAAEVASSAQEVLPFSTGVIGERLPVSRIEAALPTALSNMSSDNWESAARAIMTTDTRPKGASAQIQLDGQSITITGISKGSGMIHPDMATMLAFIVTDARIDRSLLQSCLADAVDVSFNSITVDGDTSTNDACLLAATGCAEAPEIKAGTEAYERFSRAVEAICKQLAEQIVLDGEGATKLMRVSVENAATKEEAKRVAMGIAQSPLVKTALFASDPNWGRILAVVGRSGIEQLDIEAVKIWLGDVCIVRDGGRADDYCEAAGKAVMSQDEVIVRVLLERGISEQQVLTCDFSYDYVRINAEYRT